MRPKMDEDALFNAAGDGYDARFEESWKMLGKCIRHLEEVYDPAKYKFEPMAIIEVLEKAERHPESGFDERREQVKAGSTVINLEEAFFWGFDMGVIASWDAGKQVVEALDMPRWLDTFLEVLDVAWEKGVRRLFPFDAILVNTGRVFPSSRATH